MSDGARKAVDANERDGEGGIGGSWVCVDSVGEAMAAAEAGTLCGFGEKGGEGEREGGGEEGRRRRRSRVERTEYNGE